MGRGRLHRRQGSWWPDFPHACILGWTRVNAVDFAGHVPYTQLCSYKLSEMHGKVRTRMGNVGHAVLIMCRCIRSGWRWLA